MSDGEQEAPLIEDEAEEAEGEEEVQEEEEEQEEEQEEEEQEVPLSPSLASEMQDDDPPDPSGEQVSAQALSSHPVWMASRMESPMHNGSGSEHGGFRPFGTPMRSQGGRGGGRGRGRGRGRGSGSSDAGDSYDRPRFERISLHHLQLQALQEMDGADSHLNSDDSDDDSLRHGPRTSHKKRGPRNEGYEEESEDNASEAGQRSRRRQGDNYGDQDMMASAVFGGDGRRAAPGMSDDGISETSSKRRRAAQKGAFPVRGAAGSGADCVGCVLATRITPVARFVQQNVGRMTEEMLWKMAALCYKKDVAEPCEREGVSVPPWSWKDICTHYTFHTTDNMLGRHSMIRQLSVMRHQASTHMMRVDNGEREMDKTSAELMLKIMASESRERQLLEGKATSGRQAAGSSVVSNDASQR